MGRAFPTDLGDRIFEPYVSTKDTGIGLGLAICRRIVESHGGQITASNPAKAARCSRSACQDRPRPLTEQGATDETQT